MRCAMVLRNAFKKFEQLEHRFVTFRLYQIGQRRAYAHVDEFVEKLHAANLKVVQVQREYALYDSNTDFDKGWI